MICCDKNVEIFTQQQFQGIPQANVYCLQGFDGGLDVPGVSHHVRIGKVQKHKSHVLFLHHFSEAIYHTASAHGGFLVVRVNIGGGGNELANLPRIRLLTATVEEEGHVGVLFGLGDV